MKAIKECGYEKPTPIQEQAIPIVLMMRDLIGVAQTGTGKTASFTLPMIEVLSTGKAKARMPRSLVLAPTRELAAQVAENFDLYGKYTGLTKALLVGGSSMNEQLKVLDRGADVLIATPGRLLDLFERGKILLNDIKIVVIDEADRMLDMGFIPDIEKIFSIISPSRQTLLFSATMPDEIKLLSEKFLQNPKQISVAPPASPAMTVEQFVCHCHFKEKDKTLLKIFEKEDIKNAFIFCNRKRDVDKLAVFLKRAGYRAKPLHGDMHQSVRYETLDEFREDKIEFLVCSDVAARGIDIAAVSHVFNYDIPFNADDYVHRIGRTGRAGMKGRAFALISRDDEKPLAAVEKLLGQKIEELVLNKESVSKGGSAKSSDAKSTEEKNEDSKGQGKDDKNRGNKNARKNTRSKPDNRGGTGQSSYKQSSSHRHGPDCDHDSHGGKPQESKTKSRNHGAQNNKNSRHRDDNDENTPKGFGDDVPSFFG